MEAARDNNLEDAVKKVITDAASKPQKTKEQLEQEQRDMEKAQRKLEAETIKKNRDCCARVLDTLDEETKKIFPSLDLVPGEAFLKGAVYAMGAIVHRAVEAVETTYKQERREMEVQCAKDLGKVLAPLNAKRSVFNTQKQRDIEALRSEKQVKLREAQAQIAMAYNEKIKAVDERELPEEIATLVATRDQFESDYQRKKAAHEQDEKQLVTKLRSLVSTLDSELAVTKE